jgi:hypothetical protein
VGGSIKIPSNSSPAAPSPSPPPPPISFSRFHRIEFNSCSELPLRPISCSCCSCFSCTCFGSILRLTKCPGHASTADENTTFA